MLHVEESSWYHSLLREPLAVPIFLLLLALSGVLHAQGFGSIVGTVVDPSGGVLAAAKVTITDEGTLLTRETTTNARGYYVVPSLRPATYSLTKERVRLQFRAEVFDLFNCANFMNPQVGASTINGNGLASSGPNVSGSGFGQITADNTATTAPAACCRRALGSLL